MAGIPEYETIDMTVEITAKGFDAIRYLTATLDAEKISSEMMPVLLEYVKEIGIISMQSSVMLTTGEKSTGVLADSIKGEVIKTSETEYKVLVGSALEHAKWAAMDIASTRIEHAVKVMPGRWRWIGVRPPMARHPFLDDSLQSMREAFGLKATELVGQKIDIIFSEAKGMEGSEERLG